MGIKRRTGVAATTVGHVDPTAETLVIAKMDSVVAVTAMVVKGLETVKGGCPATLVFYSKHATILPMSGAPFNRMKLSMSTTSVRRKIRATGGRHQPQGQGRRLRAPSHHQRAMTLQNLQMPTLGISSPAKPKETGSMKLRKPGTLTNRSLPESVQELGQNWTLGI